MLHARAMCSRSCCGLLLVHQPSHLAYIHAVKTSDGKVAHLCDVHRYCQTISESRWCRMNVEAACWRSFSTWVRPKAGMLRTD